MRPDINALAGAEIGWTHVVEEDEGTHHATFREGQHPADLQSATQVPASAFDDQIEYVCLLANQNPPRL